MVSAQPRPIGMASSVEQAALGDLVAELFVCPPPDGYVGIVVRQRLKAVSSFRTQVTRCCAGTGRCDAAASEPASPGNEWTSSPLDGCHPSA